MRKHTLLGAMAAVLALMAGPSARADYSSTILGLSPQPVAYWPLQETTGPSLYTGMVATNLGTLGAAGNALYCTWFQRNTAGTGTTYYFTNNVAHLSGATGDSDRAATFGNIGQYVIHARNNNPALTITAPFSIECWVYNTNANSGVVGIVSQGRAAEIGDAATGYRDVSGGFFFGQYQGNYILDLYNTNGTGGQYEITTPVTINTWQHLVVTFDGSTEAMYLDGALVAAHVIDVVNGAGQVYVPDVHDPLLIGCGPAINAGRFGGNIDEVAIYSVALDGTQIANHYNAGPNPAGPTSYSATVLADNPILYYRLNEPDISSSLVGQPPTAMGLPVAQNLGTIGAGANGLYWPGTYPAVAGPPYGGFGTTSYGVNMNQYAGVDVGGGDLTANAPALNPTGLTPFSVAAWFRGNPSSCRARFQNILGHSDQGWRFAMDNSANVGANRFNPAQGTELTFSSAAAAAANGFYTDDGNWHFLVGVADSVNAYLYIDGRLALQATMNDMGVGSPRDVIIGGDPSYTAPQNRMFDGSVAQVAFFTNALSQAQIRQIYSAAGVPPYLISQPQSAAVNAGTALSIPCVVNGSDTLSYQWYSSPSGAAVSGQTSSNLVFNPVAGANAGSYFVVANNSYGSVTSSIITLAVYTAPIIIVEPSPTNFALFVGGSASMSVTVSGAMPLYYQWQRNGAPIAGATTNNFTLSNAQLGDTGTYTCRVTNYLGQAASTPVTVSVIAATTAYAQAVLANHPLAYYRLDESSGTIAHDYASGLNGEYTPTVQLGTLGYPAVPADSDTAADFGILASADSYVGGIPLSFATPNGGNAALSVEAWVKGNAQTTDAGIITKGTGAGGEQFNLDTGSGNQSFRFFVRDASGGAHLANGNIAPDGNWHHVVGVCDQANGYVHLYVDGGLNASGTINAGSGLLSSANPVSIGSRQAGGSGSYDSQFVGTVDEVAIYNYALSLAQVQSHYYAAGIAPFITQQPTNTTANEGGTATIYAAARGTPTLAYQWYLSDGVNPTTPVPGQTGANLVINPVPMSDSGNYYQLVVTNTYGAVTSAVAQLTVQQGPPVLQADIQPLFLQEFAGGQVTYSVTVSGTAPFYYQWYLNGSAVPGAVSSTYSFAAPAGSNVYSVTIRNNYGGGTTISSSLATNIGVAITPTTRFAVNFHDAANYAAGESAGWADIVYAGQGAYPDAGNDLWNPFGVDPNDNTSGQTSVPARTSSGIGSPVTLTLGPNSGDNGGLWFDGPDGGGGNTHQGTPFFLLGNAALANGASPAAAFALSNVPPGNYVVYLYGANYDSDRGAEFNLSSGAAHNGISRAANNRNNNTFVEGENYVIFEGVAPDANGTISGTYSAFINPNTSQSGEANFNGLQLVKVPTQPVLSVRQSGTDVIVSWTPAIGVLQQATSVAGPYVDQVGLTSPHTNAVSAGPLFFRVRVPLP